MITAVPPPLGGLETAKLVLEYLKVLVWPILALYVALRYHSHFERFFHRFANETTEIEAKFLGLSAKFRDQISAKEPQDNVGKLGSSDKGKNQLSSASQEPASPAAILALEQVRLLADIFFSKPFDVRQSAAYEVKKYTSLLRLTDILSLACSPLPGERVAGGIAIREYLRTNNIDERSEEILTAIDNGLCDPLSRVRYRFVRAAEASPNIAAALKDHLEEISVSDRDAVVRKEAARVLAAV